MTIISRQEWGAAAAKAKEPLKGAAQRVVIHHTDTQTSLSVPEGSTQVSSIQSYHMTKRGFDDIGYKWVASWQRGDVFSWKFRRWRSWRLLCARCSFIIGGDGSVFEGRGWGVMGAHAKGSNHDSLGVAFLGNFNSKFTLRQGRGSHTPGPPPTLPLPQSISIQPCSC